MSKPWTTIPLLLEAIAIEDPMRPRPMISISLTGLFNLISQKVFEENIHFRP